MYFKEYYSGKISLFYGQIYFSDFCTLIPRGLFPNKPYVYVITLVNEYFFPGAAAETNTPAFGCPISYFAYIIILGLILIKFIDPFRFIYFFSLPVFKKL